MRRIGFYKTNRSGDLLHIETEGCIVNIRVGLSDDSGREVTSVEILPDEHLGERWRLDGQPNNRVIKIDEDAEDKEERRLTDRLEQLAGVERRRGRV